MRIVIAPDSFKSSLSAFEAAEAMRRGASAACAGAQIDVCPLSDGGEGLLGVLVAALGGTLRSSRVAGPLADRLDASWAMLADGRTAVIETATAIGMGLLAGEQQRAKFTTSYGVGELIREALAAGARRIALGLGGSATTDGGAGMAQALGALLEGVERPALGGKLRDLRSIDLRPLDPRLAQTELLALTDVDNPLTGADGAARTYGPQKGATVADVAELDAALTHLASVASDPGVTPGDGAAGGLGYGLRRFAGARRFSGIDFVMDAVRFDARIVGADLVLTGEGRLDAQSVRGKVVSGVSRRCHAHDVPAVVLAGAIGPGAAALQEAGLTSYFSLCNRPMLESDASQEAAPLLEELAYNVVRLSAKFLAERMGSGSSS